MNDFLVVYAGHTIVARFDNGEACAKWMAATLLRVGPEEFQSYTVWVPSNAMLGVW